VFWLSFVDPDKSLPREQQAPGTGGFLGCAIVRVDEPDVLLADDGYAASCAIRRAWDLGINPGGEVGVMGPIPEDEVPEDWKPYIERDTLLTAEEAKSL
jgi:hypothetical protein